VSNYIMAQMVDPAEGMTGRADYTAIATCVVDLATKRYHVHDIFKDRVETTEQPEIVTREYQKWAGPNFYKVGIETIFYQADLFKHLVKEGVVPLKEIPRRAGTGTAGMSKYMRLLGLAGRYTRPGGTQVLHPGMLVDGIWVPDYGNNPWLQDYEDELCSIGYVDGKEKHAHDDMGDAVASCIDMLSIFIIAQSSGNAPTYSPFVFNFS